MYVKIESLLISAKGFPSLSTQQDIKNFTLIISEPENDLLPKTEYILELENCFHEDELVQLNRKDINQLKKLAKVLVEERAVVKRSSDMATSEKENLYTLEINLGVSMGPGLTGVSQLNIAMQSAGMGHDAQSPSEQFEEAKRMMEEMRKSNNISANGKRKMAKEINEIEEENEEEDEE